MEKVKMNFRESELFYAALEGKHAALDDEKDRGYFFMSIRRDKAADQEYWNRFYDSYMEKMEELGG